MAACKGSVTKKEKGMEGYEGHVIRYRIAIVDDEYLVRKSLRKMLEEMDLPLLCIGDYSDGVELTEAMEAGTKAELVLTDAVMPHMDGVALTRWLQEKRPGVKVIFFSGHSEYNLLREALKYNAFDYILKPVDRKNLYAVLHKAIDVLEEEERQKKKDIRQFLTANELLITGYMKGGIPWHESLDMGNRPYCLVHVRWDKEALAEPEKNQLQKAGKDLLGQVGFVSVLEDRNGKKEGFVFLVFGTDNEIWRKRLKEVVHQVEEKGSFLCRESENSILVGVSRIFTETEKLPLAYEQTLQTMKKEETIYRESSQNQMLSEVLSYIRQNYRETVTLQDISEKYNYNYAYLSRVFKQETGKPFIQYLTMVRIEKAKELLRGDTSLRISDICDQVGFLDQNYFSRIFKKTVGMTPQGYRLHERGKD